jgi:hypothetical protein
MATYLKPLVLIYIHSLILSALWSDMEGEKLTQASFCSAAALLE